MGLTSTFYIAQSGLLLAQSALEIVSHNIANVNTEGYSRQRVNLETKNPYPTRVGPMGTGVDAQNITRMYDQYINRALVEKNSALAKYEAQKTTIDALESIYNESAGNGINSALSAFWNAWQDLANSSVSNNPEGNPQRTALIEQADTLTQYIVQTRTDMDKLKADINLRITEAISEANVLIKEIADINEKIVASEAGYLNQANDLRDKREQHIKELSALMDIDYYEDPRNGTVSVMTPKGTPLVLDLSSWELDAEADENGDIRVQWLRGNGGKVDITENIETGRLGGYIELRDEMMADFYFQLDAFTKGLIKEVNRQHSQGVGLVKYTDTTSTNNLSEFATEIIEFPGEDNDIKINALASGNGPENVGIKFVKAANLGDGLSVSTTYDVPTDTYNITVTLPINGAGNVTATAEEVVRAINETRSEDLAVPPPYPPTSGAPYNAGDLITASLAVGEKGLGRVTELNNPDDPIGAPFDFFRLNHQLQNILPFGDEITYGFTNAQYETELTGDDNDLIFQALVEGEPGDAISIEYVDPGAANQAMSIAVTGNKITVSLATGISGQITSTAEEIADAINSHGTARTMVTAELQSGQSGSGRVTAMTEKSLSRSGSFDLVSYNPDGEPTFHKIYVNPDDTREDILNQIGAQFSEGVEGIAAEIVQDSGAHYIRIHADEGYSFAFANDNSSALMALGLNTMFTGDNPTNIGLNDTIVNNISLIATGRIDEQGATQTGDNANALDLADLKDKKFQFRDQKGTISEAYNTLMTDVGGTAHSITRSHDFNQALVNNLHEQRDMVSAVNLDEEMSDLLKFQYMYQASAKLITAADEMLQTLLSMK